MAKARNDVFPMLAPKQSQRTRNALKRRKADKTEKCYAADTLQQYLKRAIEMLLIIIIIITIIVSPI